MKFLLSRAEFDAAVKTSKIIMTTDAVSGTHIHLPECRYVRSWFFSEKIGANGGRNGSYYFFDSVDEAVEKHDRDVCKYCFQGYRSLSEMLRSPIVRERIEQRRQEGR